MACIFLMLALVVGFEKQNKKKLPMQALRFTYRIRLKTKLFEKKKQTYKKFSSVIEAVFWYVF